MATYTVKGGDTLSQIAQILGIPMSALSGYGSNPNLIRPGQVLNYGDVAPVNTQAPQVVSAAPQTNSFENDLNASIEKYIT